MGLNELAIILFLFSFAVVALAMVASSCSRKGGDFEAFEESSSEPLTSKGQLYGDPTLCTLWPSGYSFASEGLVSHPNSTPSHPKCLLVRDGMGLLQSDIASSGGISVTNACAPIADRPELHWLNPLNQAGNGGVITDLYAENVSGIDRCVLTFTPGATSEDLTEVDTAMSIAGAQVRSQLPIVLHQLELTTASLSDSTKALGDATAQLGAASGQMTADAAAVSACQTNVRQGVVQLEALATSSQSVLASAVSTFKTQYASLQESSHQRLSARIARDEAALASAVSTQKATDEAACAGRVAAARPAPSAPAAASSSAQQSTGAAEIRSKLRDNFCVDVKGGSKDAMAEVFMYNCQNQDNQRWTFDGGRRLVSQHSGMCLNVSGGSTEDGAKIIQYPCSDSANQLWRIKDDGTIRPDHAPEKCLDVYGNLTENESKLNLWTCNGGNNQKWSTTQQRQSPAAASRVTPEQCTGCTKSATGYWLNNCTCPNASGQMVAAQAFFRAGDCKPPMSIIVDANGQLQCQ